MAIAVIVPQVYSEYKDFLPPFEKLVDKVMIQLSTYYTAYIAEKELDKDTLTIGSFMSVYNWDLVKKWEDRTSYMFSDILTRIIHREFSFNEDVKIKDAPFVWHIRKMSDDEGYEEWESEKEQFESIYNAIIEMLMDDVKDHIDDLWINELQAYAEEIAWEDK